MFLCHRSATCALTVTLVTLSCGVAARAQVGVAQRAPLAPVGVAPVGAGAGVVTAPAMGATPVGAVGGVKASGVNTGLLLLIGQIADGQMTLDESWEKGLLDAPKVLQLLSQTQRFTEDTRNETMQHDLAGLLVRFAPESVAKPEKLSARVRVALCLYYADKGDARAVPLCEALIAEKLDGKQINQPLASNPDGGSSSLWLTSVISLARYYQNVGQWQQAGETWERALTFWQDASWWQAGVRVDAARAYKRTGTPKNQEKAAQLYAQVPSFGNAWDTVMARYDHALPLMDAGKLDEAQAILSQPLELGEHSEFGAIAQNTWLAQIAYRKGNLDNALRLSEIVVNTGKGVALTNAPVRGIYSIAQDLYARSGGWKKQPIQTETKEVIFEINPDEPNRTQYKRFRVKTYGDTSITVHVANPAFQVRILPLDTWRSDGLNPQEQEAEVLVETSANRPNTNVPLVLSSAVSSRPVTVLLSLEKKLILRQPVEDQHKN